MVWQHAIVMVTMVQLSQRGKLRRVDALVRKSICLALRFVVRVGSSLWAVGKTH